MAMRSSSLGRSAIQGVAASSGRSLIADSSQLVPADCASTASRRAPTAAIQSVTDRRRSFDNADARPSPHAMPATPRGQTPPPPSDGAARKDSRTRFRSSAALATEPSSRCSKQDPLRANSGRRRNVFGRQAYSAKPRPRRRPEPSRCHPSPAGAPGRAAGRNSMSGLQNERPVHHQVQRRKTPSSTTGRRTAPSR